MNEVRPDHLEQPDRRRFDPSHPAFHEVIARHHAAVQAGRPNYRDPVSGFMVFTAAFLAARGQCCDSGCRHCPFVGSDPGSGC